jgi:hypothetical protein
LERPGLSELALDPDQNPIGLESGIFDQLFVHHVVIHHLAEFYADLL